MKTRLLLDLHVWQPDGDVHAVHEVTVDGPPEAFIATQRFSTSERRRLLAALHLDGEPRRLEVLADGKAVQTSVEVYDLTKTPARRRVGFRLNRPTQPRRMICGTW